MATMMSFQSPPDVRTVTNDWGSTDEVTLYLDRCQVDTPDAVVADVWRQVLDRRNKIGKVVDFGAGDGRFAEGGGYSTYTGYEVDGNRVVARNLPANATIVHKCAFSDLIQDADLCVGNPPYVRNQDLPQGWRQRAAKIIQDRTGVRLSGLGNAWQYFFLLALASTHKTGLVALVIPYEWVSRPSAAAIRAYIREQGWRVSVYRLLDDTFPRVLTTSAITVVDKNFSDGVWKFYQQSSAESFDQLTSVTATSCALLPYQRSRLLKAPHAKRGLSPGTQRILTLTEPERARLGLQIGKDVVPCVTTLRHLPAGMENLNKTTFRKYYVHAGKKCWLLNTSTSPSKRLSAYLDSIPAQDRATSTCKFRDVWWKFTMPQSPALLVATGFVTASTKAIVNSIGTHAVGGVCGVYAVPKSRCALLAKELRTYRIADEIVPHSNGLRKLEINQLNTLLCRLYSNVRKGG